jgi:hypothetical protein
VIKVVMTRTDDVFGTHKVADVAAALAALTGEPHPLATTAVTDSQTRAAS